MDEAVVGNSEGDAPEGGRRPAAAGAADEGEAPARMSPSPSVDAALPMRHEDDDMAKVRSGSPGSALRRARWDSPAAAKALTPSTSEAALVGGGGGIGAPLLLPGESSSSSSSTTAGGQQPRRGGSTPPGESTAVATTTTTTTSRPLSQGAASLASAAPTATLATTLATLASAAAATTTSAPMTTTTPLPTTTTTLPTQPSPSSPSSSSFAYAPTTTYGGAAEYQFPRTSPTFRGPSDRRDSVSCPQSLVGRLIGKRGETIKDLQRRSGARIQIDQNYPEGHPRLVTVEGEPRCVQVGVKLVQELIGSSPAVGNGAPGRLTTFECPKNLVGRVIGKGGETINELQRRSNARIQIEQRVPEGAPCVVEVQGEDTAVREAIRLTREVMKGQRLEPHVAGLGLGGVFGSSGVGSLLPPGAGVGDRGAALGGGGGGVAAMRGQQGLPGGGGQGGVGGQGAGVGGQGAGDRGQVSSPNLGAATTFAGAQGSPQGGSPQSYYNLAHQQQQAVLMQYGAYYGGGLPTGHHGPAGYAYASYAPVAAYAAYGPYAYPTQAMPWQYPPGPQQHPSPPQSPAPAPSGENISSSGSSDNNRQRSASLGGGDPTMQRQFQQATTPQTSQPLARNDGWSSHSDSQGRTYWYVLPPFANFCELRVPSFPSSEKSSFFFPSSSNTGTTSSPASRRGTPRQASRLEHTTTFRARRQTEQNRQNKQTDRRPRQEHTSERTRPPATARCPATPPHPAPP